MTKSSTNNAITTTAAAATSTSGSDIYARCRTTGSTSAGRGSQAGWTPCPLCCNNNNNNHSFIIAIDKLLKNNNCSSSAAADNEINNNDTDIILSTIITNSNTNNNTSNNTKNKNTKSIKLFSHGRGLSAHIHAVHTPWSPGKRELKRRLAYQKRMENEAKRRTMMNKKRLRDDGDDDDNVSCCSEKRHKMVHNLHANEDSNISTTYTKEVQSTTTISSDDKMHNNDIDDDNNDAKNNNNNNNWEEPPTSNEIQCWNALVMQIVALVETKAKQQAQKEQGVSIDDGDDVIGSSSIGYCNVATGGDNKVDIANKRENDNGTTITISNNANTKNEGRDRTGNVCLSYKQSLPSFLAAAADGDLMKLQALIIEDYCASSSGSASSIANLLLGGQEGEEQQQQQLDQERITGHIKSLLSLRDRNGSTAEHWAAGGGHLDCIRYLLDMRDLVNKNDGTKKKGSLLDETTAVSSSSSANNDDQQAQHQQQTTSKRVRRRRDGKTSLHYAARNGHNDIIDLLLSRHDVPNVDIPSGDGTTPLHLACYGGHLSTVRHLIEVHNANVHATNEWQCSTSHWAAMSIGMNGPTEVIELCDYLIIKCGVDFSICQKQGHTPLHKAASKKNRHVIEWMANHKSLCPDDDDYDDDDDEKNKEKKKLLGSVDVGGNRPSDIWSSVGGDLEFGIWMKEKCGW